MVDRLGNLTLLESARNRTLGNAPYSEKVAVYGESNYTLTRHIQSTAPEHWTPELLDARQQQLAERAVHLWQVDFS